MTEEQLLLIKKQNNEFLGHLVALCLAISLLSIYAFNRFGIFATNAIIIAFLIFTESRMERNLHTLLRLEKQEARKYSELDDR